MDYIHYLGNKIACIERNSLARLKVNLDIVFLLDIYNQLFKCLYIIIISGYVMTAAEVQPLSVVKILAEAFLDSLKGFYQIVRVLLTQRMKMKAVNICKQIGSKIRLSNAES